MTLLLVVLWLTPSTSGAQNLLTNPDFASFADWIGSGWWVLNDCCGEPQSGSATYINQQTGPSNVFIARQCVELMLPGQYYEISGFFHIPAGQTGSGWGQIGVGWYSSGSCASGNFIGGADAPIVMNTGSWRRTSAVIKAPFAAVSAYVFTINQKWSSGGTFQVSTDSLSLIVVDPIFSDGFESGDTLKWSAAVP